MGQDIPKTIIPPPLSLLDCFVNGRVDLSRYVAYRRRVDIQTADNLSRSKNNKRKRKLNCFLLKEFNLEKNKHHRSVKRHKLIVRESNGALKDLKPTDTLWFLMYINQRPYYNILLKYFRLRLRLSYDMLLSLRDDIMEHELFLSWKSLTQLETILQTLVFY